MSRWTDTRVEQLKKLWKEGASAGEIADTLGDGFSRNSVLGKIWRLRINDKEKQLANRSFIGRQKPSGSRFIGS